MNTNRRNTMKLKLLAATSLACCIALPAWAIDEIVVTTQKRTQNIQDVSAAVTNISGQDFDVLNISSAFDLSDKVPGLVINNVQGYRRTIDIRGIGNELPDNAATKPAVAYHVDGVFMSNDFALFNDLVDIDRVEVTRGPDGTIYGNSSSGGAVNVITKHPNFDGVSGFIDEEVGSYSTTNTRGSFNLPLFDTLALRVSGSHREHNGFTKNVPNPNASPLDIPGAFRDLDDENNTTLNGQLMWQATPDFSALVTFTSFHQDINGPALKGGFDTVSSDPRVVSHDTTEFFKVDNNIGSLILNWDGSSYANVKGLFSYQRYKMSRRLDADRSSLTANDPAPLPTVGIVDLLGELPIRQHVGGLTQKDRTYTAEIDVTSPEDQDSMIDWLVGGFFMDTRINSDTRNFFDRDRDGLPVNTTIIGFGNPDRDFQNSDERSFQSYSFFGNVSVHLLDRLTVTGGARRTTNDFTDKRCNIFNGCLTAGGRTGTPATPSEKKSNWTWKAAVEYALTDENMVYAKVSTGKKPAASNNGFVVSMDAVEFFPEVFKEEKVTSYEVGSKNRFLDDRLQFNVSAYYYKINNFLFNSAGLNVFGAGVSGGTNLPKSKVYGVEIESIAELTENLTLDVNLSAADSNITKGRLVVDRGEQVNITAGLTDPAAITAAILGIAKDVTGNELPKIPNVVANVRLTYDREVMDLGVLTSSVTYNHRGKYFNRVFNSPTRDVVKAYNLVNLNFHFQPDSNPFSFDFKVQNVLNTDAVSSVHTDDFFQGVTSFQLLPPRVVTFRIRYTL